MLEIFAVFFDIWKQKHPTCELKVEELLRLRNEDSVRTKLNDDTKQEEIESQENKEMPLYSDDEKVIKSDTIENSYNKYSPTCISNVPARDKGESSSFEFIVDEDYETLKESPSLEVENWKVEHCLKLNILAAVCGSLVIQSFQGTTDDPLPVFCPLFPKKKKSPCLFLIASETGWELLNHVNKLHIDLIQPNEEWKMCSDCDLYLPSQEVANYHFQLVHEDPAVDPKVASKEVNIDSLSEWQHVEAVADEDNDKRLGELINQYYEQEIERIKFVEEEYKRKIVLDKQKAKELEEERKRQKEIEIERKLQAIDDKREKELSKVKLENSQNDDIIEINDDSMTIETKKGLKVSELNIKTSKDLDEIEIPIAEEWTRKMIPIFLNQLKCAKNGNSLSSNALSIEYNSSNKRPNETVENLFQNDDSKRIKQENVDNLTRSTRHNNNYPFDITSITEKASSSINKGREKSGLDSIMASLNSISENPIGVRNLGGLF